MAEHNERIHLEYNEGDGASLRRDMSNAAREFGRLMDAPLIAKIDAISGDDPEAAHGELDDLLEARVSSEVKDAIQRLKDRCSWWAGA